MKGITSRFVMLVVTAAVVPLLVYGVVSISSLRSATRRSIVDGNLNVATRAADQIDRYVSTTLKVLQAVAADLHGTNLEPWQRDRILKNYLLEFPEFREITLFDPAGRPSTSSRAGSPGLTIPPAQTRVVDGVLITPVTVDDDLLPTTTAAVRVQAINGGDGWLVGEFNLVELWRMVDSIRVGERGFALLVAEDGRLVAHGDPNEKRRVALGDTLDRHPLVGRLRASEEDIPLAGELVNASGTTVLAVAARVTSLGWTLIVEQPTAEAYALATRAQRQLTVAITFALISMVTVGYLWARSFIRPIFALIRATQGLAAGRLDERVHIRGQGELEQLGDAFNRMAGRLVELQEDVRKQERQAMFGRIAVGLAHDLSHPIQNLGNSCKLILKMSDDPEYRETFQRTVRRELATTRRVLENLRNLARPIPLERIPLDLNRALAEVGESMQPQAETAGVMLEARLCPDPLFVEADLFALGRVCRNLITNALQATATGGRVIVSTERRAERAVIQVSDTGCGIPADRLGNIFDDFVTTKRRGLGLGLAISRKIVEQLDGAISVTSEVGAGTTFVIELPLTSSRPMAVAAS